MDKENYASAGRLRDIEIAAHKASLLVRLHTEMFTGLSFPGQAGQDLLAYLYFRGKKSGFFLDIGAHDGRTYNNSYVFEQLGWRGACVEPLPGVFTQLRRNRRCDCYQAAMAGGSAPAAVFIHAVGVDTLSGLESDMAGGHEDWIVREGGRPERITVRVITFSELMACYPLVRTIDFLSLNVEGAEMGILKTIDFEKYDFGLITVECIGEKSGEGEELRGFMAGKGYGVLADLGLDLVFAPQSRIETGEFPGKPVHVIPPLDTIFPPGLCRASPSPGEIPGSP
ncbi:MAG: FkbM family methyltransferase [Treponema sp.]|jgi:FkbM family methyltransferase|nr:FkbM family methyltransferase [Treponema sp.]